MQDIIRRHARLFTVLDDLDLDESLDSEIVLALQLEPVLQKAATIQNEENIDEEEKARFLTSIVS